MRGQVLGVDLRTGDGIVTGEDGRRYHFRPKDWAYRGEPAVGMYVDFETQESRALSIFPVPGTVPASAELAAEDNDRNKIVAALLAFFLGPLGVHRFYLGQTGLGILMIVLTCTVIGAFFSALWGFIDAVRLLAMSDREFARRYARDS